MPKSNEPLNLEKRVVELEKENKELKRRLKLSNEETDCAVRSVERTNDSAKYAIKEIIDDVKPLLLKLQKFEKEGFDE